MMMIAMATCDTYTPLRSCHIYVETSFSDSIRKTFFIFCSSAIPTGKIAVHTFVIANGMCVSENIEIYSVSLKM